MWPTTQKTKQLTQTKKTTKKHSKEKPKKNNPQKTQTTPKHTPSPYQNDSDNPYLTIQKKQHTTKSTYKL